MTIDLFTIGFTQSTAEHFFARLAKNDISMLVDIRLHPDGQLSGFAKKDDLAYFLGELIHSRYIHVPRLAPTDEILKAYRSSKDWNAYSLAYLSLLEKRGIPETLDQALFVENRCCLLCSEALPTHCHRKLAADYIAKFWQSVTITHI